MSRLDDLLHFMDISLDTRVASVCVERDHKGLNRGRQFVNRRANVGIQAPHQGNRISE